MHNFSKYTLSGKNKNYFYDKVKVNIIPERKIQK